MKGSRHCRGVVSAAKLRFRRSALARSDCKSWNLRSSPLERTCIPFPNIRIQTNVKLLGIGAQREELSGRMEWRGTDCLRVLISEISVRAHLQHPSSGTCTPAQIVLPFQLVQTPGAVGKWAELAVEHTLIGAWTPEPWESAGRLFQIGNDIFENNFCKICKIKISEISENRKKLLTMKIKNWKKNLFCNFDFFRITKKISVIRKLYFSFSKIFEK